ncbi:YkgJ family cysteine cluster protein [Candidatus Electrothrix sp.]|uniref:YkgJ family cysteine cluster protein n=1 Tax=Candidatus Electrothrix sp. TaxID=2170559 RepID=UPI004055EC3F
MPAKNLQYHNDYPYFFKSDACKSCGGKCCRGQQGYIRINMEELGNMANAKGLSPKEFARQYVRQVTGGLSLQERIINNEHFCCFLDPVDHYCTIYQQRPEQCRTFPFWEEFKEEPEKLFLSCPGIISVPKPT